MYTAYDVIEYLLSSTGGGAQDQEHRALRQSLFHGYRDLMSVRDWKWHQANDTISLTSADLVTTYRLPWGVQHRRCLHAAAQDRGRVRQPNRLEAD